MSLVRIFILSVIHEWVDKWIWLQDHWNNSLVVSQHWNMLTQNKKIYFCKLYFILISFSFLSLYYFPWHWPCLGGKKSITSWITIWRNFICNKDVLKHFMYKKSPNYFCYSRAQKALPWHPVRHFFLMKGPKDSLQELEECAQ